MDRKSKVILFVGDEGYHMKSHAEYLELKGLDIIYAR